MCGKWGVNVGDEEEGGGPSCAGATRGIPERTEGRGVGMSWCEWWRGRDKFGGGGWRVPRDACAPLVRFGLTTSKRKRERGVATGPSRAVE
jgi:hypothetical protein